MDEPPNTATATTAITTTTTATTTTTTTATMPAPLGSHLTRTLRAFQIYGANTNVGKTIFSTILAKASRRHFPAEHVFYLKPVSTGAPEDADDGHVARFAAAEGVRAECLLQYSDPVSPHLVAVEPPTDESLLSTIRSRIAAYRTPTPSTLLLETAGGVHSPTLSGASQADLYRPLRLPVLLVADARLGGISASIAAFECLHMRGYDVEGVLLFADAYYRNDGYLRRYFARRGISTVVVPAPPPPPPREEEEGDQDREAMQSYYEARCGDAAVREMLLGLKRGHDRRIEKLAGMADEAVGTIWYPFTQHRGLAAGAVAAIDSAHGDFFQTYAGGGEEDDALLGATFDGSASWWTQGLGHANPELTLAAAYAAGRYGHVMFANAVHEPGLELAKTLLAGLSGPGGRMARVFYSDNGSTGCEVAVKMGLRASRARYGWDHRQREAGVIGLKGSYHGDTIGVMDCAEPGVYNGEAEWYRGRGHWFDFPKVGMKRGRWTIEVPEEMRADLGPDVAMASLSDIFDLQHRTASELGKSYQKHILKTLERLTQAEGRRFGAAIIEPLVLGAGGMLFCDPLFQHTLVATIRGHPGLFSPAAAAPADSNAWSGLPVIFDEVFTGMYRLGRLSAASFLQTEADISVHAKLLTGGLLPLCATLASESVFGAFLGGEKKDALLHGHSYTAHAVGCSVARESVRMLVGMDERGDWAAAKADWRQEGEEVGEVGEVWSVWTRAFVERVSFIGEVESVWALGSVLAVNLRAGDNAGYSSDAAQGFLQKMGSRDSREWNVHARALGNVVYIMASQTTGAKTVEVMQEEILKALGA